MFFFYLFYRFACRIPIKRLSFEQCCDPFTYFVRRALVTFAVAANPEQGGNKRNKKKDHNN